MFWSMAMAFAFIEDDYLLVHNDYGRVDNPRIHCLTQAAAMAEIRGEAEPGEVYGRPLSDFEEPPPVLLECMG